MCNLIFFNYIFFSDEMKVNMHRIVFCLISGFFLFIYKKKMSSQSQLVIFYSCFSCSRRFLVSAHLAGYPVSGWIQDRT